jgi:hypothetical protein
VRARIRTIKPELFLDEELWDLGVETGLPVLQGFQGLWCYADREGRFVWRPRALKPLILPYWDGDFSRVLDALWSRRFLVRYTSSTGQDLGAVRTFKRHQLLNNRETPSELPDIATCEAREPHASPTRAPRDTFLLKRSGSGSGSGNGPGPGPVWEGESEGELVAPAPKTKRRGALWHRVPESWNPDEKTLAVTRALLTDRFEIELQKFRDWEFKDGKSDADAAWRNWARRAAEQGPGTGSRGPKQTVLHQPNAGKTGWE